MSNEKMPERIRAGLIETYPQIKIQCWREETPGYPDPELKTVYLRSTPVLEHAAEMRNAALAYQELSVCYRVGKHPTEKLFKRLEKANDLLATIEAEEREVQE